jgi:hypothetical protein
MFTGTASMKNKQLVLLFISDVAGFALLLGIVQAQGHSLLVIG